MRFRPCIDLHKGKVKQIVGSTLNEDSREVVENFVAEHDADYYAEMFKRDKIPGGHVIMLGEGNESQAEKALKAYKGGLQIGGGINDTNAASYLEKGASHVIVTSFVFKDGDIDFKNLKRLCSEIGRERLVLDLSCRQKEGKYYVVTDRWQKFTEYEVNKSNLELLSNFCHEFLIHAVDVEGKRQGIDRELVSCLGEWVPISTTYAGGVRSFDDIESILKLGNGKLDITIGSALDIFGGSLAYNDIVRWFWPRILS